MKKTMLSVAAVLAIGVGSAQAADLPAKVYTKAPPVVAFDPWDVAFGAAISSDYLFRGISQSNQKPSVTAYFEPRYNVTKDLQLYIGASGESISFANRAAAEVDVYGGIRPTFGAFAFDFGVWGYLYPGGKCADSAGAFAGGAFIAGGGSCPFEVNTVYLSNGNGNVMKKDVSFYEAYGKVNYTFNDTFSLGATAFYSPNFLNFGTEGTYASVVGKVIVPPTWFGTSGVGAFVSGEFGRQWLGRADAFYANAQLPDYNTWNVGVGFTYKVFTLDLRYTDTDLNKGQCQAITSDFSSNGTASNWCGERFTAKLSADVTLQAIK